MKANYELPKWVSKPARDLLGRILETDPNLRATVSEIRDHPWYFQVKDDRSQNDLSSLYLSSVYDSLTDYGYDRKYVKN